MSKNGIFSWRLTRQLWKLPVGTWVAIDNDKIIATGQTPKEVYEASQVAGVEVPLLWQVPDPNVTHIFAAVGL